MESAMVFNYLKHFHVFLAISIILYWTLQQRGCPLKNLFQIKPSLAFKIDLSTMQQTVLKKAMAASPADKIQALLCIFLLFSSLIKILGDETIQKSNLPAMIDFIFNSLITVIYVSLPKEYFLDSDPQVRLKRKEEMSRCHTSIAFLILKSVS